MENKEKKPCYCCKKEKEGSYVVYRNFMGNEQKLWVCKDCNYLPQEPKE